MTDLGPIELKIDSEALKAQIETALNSALEAAAWALRAAADQLHPQFVSDQEKWIQYRIDEAVAKALAEA